MPSGTPCESFTATTLQLWAIVSQRGKPKYLGGNGRKTTGITKRYFRKNMQRVRLVENGVTVRRWVPVSMIRAGLIQKPVVREPFTLPELEGDS
tara:strand:- start:103 stop:384 length:282 start_codon:yes stop_codon:yes gene_type:complete